MDNVGQAEGRLEFLAYINQKKDKNGEPKQDFWTLRFWFPKLALINKNRVMTDYFRELVNPKKMPRNYINFVKRALVVLREYRQIARVELEVEESQQPALDESLGPIQSFISVFTPESFTYQFVPEVTVANKNFITFSVKASQDAHVALSAIYGDVDRKTYEIALGADGNSTSYIRDGSLGTAKAEARTRNILSSSERRDFWISWKDNQVEVGQGSEYGVDAFLTWAVPVNRRFHVNCISVATSRKSKGEWEFTEIIEEYPEVEKEKVIDPVKEAKRALIRRQILWVAKKQRMLECLEDVYPNTITVNEIFKLCKIQQNDVISATVVLKDLQKRKLIKEISSGSWVRIQSEEDNSNDVQIVEKLPKLSNESAPRIAIVTELYCEKSAVDAMVDDKTTYIKYVKGAQGKSHVYTIGRINGHVIVTTKLSKKGDNLTDDSKSKLAISELLGEFPQVKNVLLVGVGGAVPSYNNYSKHVRLGDIVVSTPRDQHSPVYYFCSKVEKMPGSNQYKYSTKEYKPSNTSLLRAVNVLRQHSETLNNGVKPWLPYVEAAMDILKGQESNFHRPSIRTDRLYFTKRDGIVIECDHPRPADKTYKDGQTRVAYGAIAGSRLVARTQDLRLDFAAANDVKSFDSGSDAILDTIDSVGGKGYAVIRGMCDYLDGSKKEWQCYASLVAAAYMKALIMTL